jgi:hypothetical protein
MTEVHEEQLKQEIQHIFDSGANEIRVLEMVKNFINNRQGELNKLPIHSVVSRYFVVAYRVKKANGLMADGQINITVKGVYMSRARVIEIIKESDPENIIPIITNIIELTEEEFNVWVAKE